MLIRIPCQLWQRLKTARARHRPCSSTSCVVEMENVALRWEQWENDEQKAVAVKSGLASGYNNIGCYLSLISCICNRNQYWYKQLMKAVPFQRGPFPLCIFALRAQHLGHPHRAERRHQSGAHDGDSHGCIDQREPGGVGSGRDTKPLSYHVSQLRFL